MDNVRHKVVKRQLWGEVESVAITLLQIYCWVCQWQNFDMKQLWQKFYEEKVWLYWYAVFVACDVSYYLIITVNVSCVAGYFVCHGCECVVLQGTLSVMAVNVWCVTGYFVCHGSECDVLQGTLSVMAVNVWCVAGYFVCHGCECVMCYRVLCHGSECDMCCRVLCLSWLWMCDVLQGTLSVMAVNVWCVTGYFVCHGSECDMCCRVLCLSQLWMWCVTGYFVCHSCKKAGSWNSFKENTQLILDQVNRKKR